MEGYNSYHQQMHQPTNAYTRDPETRVSKIRTSLTCAVFTHLVLFITVFLVFIYILNWPVPDAVADAQEHWKFQWHPILMVSAFVLFMGEAIIAYRILPFDHGTQKMIHFVLHSLALVCASIAFWAIVTFHNVNNIPHFYNAHSIAGISTLVIFYVQYLIGFISFLAPRLPDEPRAAVMPYHKYIGIVLFLFTWLAMLSGLMDRMRITLPKGTEFTPPYRMGNALAAFILLSGATIAFHFGPVPQKHDKAESERLL